jgi:hypothetical protein
MEKIDVMDLTLEEMWSVSRITTLAFGCLDLLFPTVDVEMDITVGDLYGISQQIIAESSGYCE